MGHDDQQGRSLPLFGTPREKAPTMPTAGLLPISYRVNK
jgi:hypothetical protein